MGKKKVGPWGRIKKNKRHKKLFLRAKKLRGMGNFNFEGFTLSVLGIKGNRGEKTHFWHKKTSEGKICAFDCSLGKEDWSFCVETIFHADKKRLCAEIN